MRSTVLSAALFVGMASAHIGCWHPGSYCLDGSDPGKRMNSDNIALPLYQLPKFGGWWFHGVDGCDRQPPPEGTFLELPAGGSFKVELAANRGKTTLAFDGAYTTPWGDGLEHDENYNDPNCIQSPQLHTKDRSGVVGSSFAIAYVSDISQVTMENLVVFTTNYDTPWKREAWFQVPADLPPCPPGGCICSWNWIPKGCGQPNMYMNGLKCKVTGSTSTKVVAPAKPAVWCEDDPSKCVKGPKQILVWNQAEGNNIFVDGRDRGGDLKYPRYGEVCGFSNGPQNDIFVEGGSGNPTPPVDIPAPAPSSPVNNPSPPVNQPSNPPVNQPSNPPVDPPKPTPPVENPTPPSNPPVQNPAPSNPPVQNPSPPSTNPTPPVDKPGNPNPNPSPDPYLPEEPNTPPAPSPPVGVPAPVPPRRCRARGPNDPPKGHKRGLHKRVRHKHRSHDL